MECQCNDQNFLAKGTKDNHKRKEEVDIQMYYHAGSNNESKGANARCLLILLCYLLVMIEILFLNAKLATTI